MPKAKKPHFERGPAFGMALSLHRERIIYPSMTKDEYIRKFAHC
jgi:hypothetical protein